MSSDLTTPDQAIDALLDAVGAAMARTAPPRRLAGDALADYLGDVVHLTFSGTDAERVALLARLLLVARVAAAARRGDLGTTAWLRRLERPLRRWERGRVQGTANPRPRPDELDARVAMFGAALGPDPVIEVDTVAIAVAELVAVHQLAGATTVEEGVAAREALRALVEEAAALLTTVGSALEDGVFERPGATLAHVEHATWQVAQILQHPVGVDERAWLRGLWLEIAAALVCAHDAYDRRADHGERWRVVHDLAAEKLTVGGLLERPDRFDVTATIALVQAVALQLAGLWLDEALGGSELPSASMLEDRLQAAAAQALVAAWAAASAR